MENKKISERPFAYSGRGGARPGAGRPKGSKSPNGVRPMKSMKARDDEWELIKAFARIVKKDPERAKRILETE